jgi:hypothetical protein
MHQFGELDLERSVTRAWTAFQRHLAGHVRGMGDSDLLVIEVPSGDGDPDGAPYVQFSAWGAGLVRCEASSNASLRVSCRLDAAAERSLVELGWRRPTCGADDEPRDGSPNYFIDLRRDRAEQLAAMTVTALRRVWSVPHPAFLSAEGLRLESVEPVDLGVGSGPSEPVADLPAAVVPRGREDLGALVVRALATVLGHTPHRDADGDVPVRTSGALTFVRVHRTEPVVELLCPLVEQVTDRARAADLVAELNRGRGLVRLSLVEDSVVAGATLPALPFVAQHLRDALELMGETVETFDAAVATATGGRLTFAEPVHAAPGREYLEAEPGEELPVDLLTLLRVEVTSGGALRSDDVVAICGADRATILDFLRAASRQAREWRRAAGAAAGVDPQEVDACTHEAQAWEHVVAQLRSALRRLLLPEEGPRPLRLARPLQPPLFEEPPDADGR